MSVICICTSHVKSAICKIRLENFWVFWSLLYWSLLFFTWLTPAWYAHGAFLIALFTSCLPMLLVANFFASLKPVLRTFLSFLFLYLQFFETLISNFSYSRFFWHFQIVFETYLFQYLSAKEVLIYLCVISFYHLIVHLHLAERKSHPGMKKFLFTREFHSGMKFNLK